MGRASREVSDAQPLEPFARTPARLGAWHAVEAQPRLGVLLDRGTAEKRTLEDGGGGSSDRRSAGGLTVQQQVAGDRADERAGHSEQGRLARPVCAEHGGDQPGAEGEPGDVQDRPPTRFDDDAAKVE